MSETKQPRLIRKRNNGNRISYDVEYNSKTFEVHETITERGDTHSFIVLSMKTPPSEEEENTIVLFIKGMTEEKEPERGVKIGAISSLPKTDKPWGTERKLSSFPQYVLKEIILNAGQRTSLQFHNKKSETLAFISGEAIVHYRNKNGEMKTLNAEPGTVVEFPPFAQHRVQAKTDTRYFEASTPEYPNDTVRIDDDYGRRVEK